MGQIFNASRDSNAGTLPLSTLLKLDRTAALARAAHRREQRKQQHEQERIQAAELRKARRAKEIMLCHKLRGIGISPELFAELTRAALADDLEVA